METVERDFSQQGVKFYYVYKALAHPETNGYVTPFDLKERLMHISEAKRTLGSRIRWLCDTMDNDLKHALGDRPNSEFIIDPQGEIIVAREWSKPSQLRKDLAGLIGEVAEPTQLGDLNLKQRPPPAKAATGVVPRIALPGAMQPAKIEVIETNELPLYAKLRAEIGQGKLYLGFFLDPLYKVHWNNEAPSLKFSIDPPHGITLSPASGEGPAVEIEADADPREFLVAVTGTSTEPLRVMVSYFACDDAETFCKPVSQEYLVMLERDPDGGRRRLSGGNGGGRNNSAGRRMAQDMMRRMPILRALDQDRDGELSEAEIEAASEALSSLDRNGDGAVTEAEYRREGPNPR